MADRSATLPAAVRGYLRLLASRDRRGTLRLWLWATGAALTEGAGLLLLVPLLALAGVVPGDPPDLPGPFGAPGLPVVLAAFVAVAAGRALIVRGRDLQVARLRLGTVDGLRLDLYRAAAAANWAHLARLRRSDLLQTLTADVLRVGTGVQFTIELTVSALLGAVYLAVAAYLAPPAAAAAAVVAGLMLVLAAPRVRRSRRLGALLTAGNRRLYAAATEFLDGVKEAKAGNREDGYVAAFAAAAAGERGVLLDHQRATAGTAAAYATGGAAALAAVVALAVGWLDVAPAHLLVLVAIFARLVPLAGTLLQRAQQLAHTAPALHDVAAALAACRAAAEPDDPPAEPVAPPRSGIRLRGVTVRLSPDRPAQLADVDLFVPAGVVTAVVGPSGAGKSTVADVLCGLVSPTRGRLEVDGRTVDDALRRSWRSRVAYVPQEATLTPGTIADNLRAGRPDAADEQLWAALRAAAADQFVRALPNGLATEVGERGICLSGGERQRLSLARALLRRPAVLILDESTSALDRRHARQVNHALRALRGALTIVVIAHRRSAVRDADHVVVLDGGRVAGAGSWAELGEAAGELVPGWRPGGLG